MPVFTHIVGEGAIMTIDTSSGRVVFNGVTYHNPCTLESKDGESTYKSIEPDVFIRVQFEKIVKHGFVENGNRLVIDPVGWNVVFLEKMSTPGLSLLGSRRVS